MIKEFYLFLDTDIVSVIEVQEKENIKSLWKKLGKAIDNRYLTIYNSSHK